MCSSDLGVGAPRALTRAPAPRSRARPLSRWDWRAAPEPIPKPTLGPVGADLVQRLDKQCMFVRVHARTERIHGVAWRELDVARGEDRTVVHPLIDHQVHHHAGVRARASDPLGVRPADRIDAACARNVLRDFSCASA